MRPKEGGAYEREDIARDRRSSETLAHEARQDQLLTLVGELLETNQELRFKLARAERAAERAATESSAVYGMLIP